MQYLVDSDWAISYLNGVRRTIQRVNGLSSYGVGISIISLAEIYEGIYGSPDREQQERLLSAFLRPLELVPVDDVICRIFGQERRRLRSIGDLIGDMDLLIGATAIRHNVTLLTNNRRHFTRMQGISILSEQPDDRNPGIGNPIS